jgi:transcriptional regulator with XRE-family HTH domain
MTTRNELGALIRQAREANGLTVREAAARLDVDFTHYTRIERGERGLGKYARPVAKLYGLNADELEAMATDKLPNFAPYLRAKYDLTDEAIAELEGHFQEVAKQRRPKSGRVS